MRFAKILTAAAVAAGLTACGGGGGAELSANTPADSAVTISGTAAIGAPLPGASITVRGANGQQATATANEAGEYLFDVEGLTAPIMLRATGMAGGQQYTLFSASATLPSAPGEGSVLNATPLTTAVTGQALGAAPESAFESFDDSTIRAEQLNLAKQQLATALNAVFVALGQPANVDPFSAAFRADNTGLDKLLDLVSFSYNPAVAPTLFVVDKGTGESVEVDLEREPTRLSAPPTASLPLEGIKTLVNAFNASAGVAQQRDQFASLIDMEFVDEGMNRAQLIAENETYITNGTRLAIRNVVIDGCKPASAMSRAVCEIKGQFYVNDRLDDTIEMPVVLDTDSKWKLYGNQEEIEFDLNAVYNAANIQPMSGLNLSISTEDAVSAQLFVSVDGGSGFSQAPIAQFTNTLFCTGGYLTTVPNGEQPLDGCSNFQPLTAEQVTLYNRAALEGKLVFKVVAQRANETQSVMFKRVRTPLFTDMAGQSALTAANIVVNGLGTSTVTFSATGLAYVNFMLSDGSTLSADDEDGIKELGGTFSTGTNSTVSAMFLNVRDPLGRSVWTYRSAPIQPPGPIGDRVPR